ncbi:D-alanine--D-alanyl carrier protein ligase [Streptomyces badius]
MADEETRHDHDALAGFVRRHQVQKAILPVSLAHALATRFEHDPSAFASLREIATTGEQLRLSAPMLAFFERLDGCRLINNYGPAETHVVTSYTFSGPPRKWPRYAPIGRPIQNVALGLESSDGLRAVPRGSVGELVIGGPCVATGYLHDPDLTQVRFTVSADGRRQYRSGDRARLLPQDEVAFLGRRDQQVKIRGYRVEPGEIELVIRKDPDVADVALVVRGAEGDRRIDAYLVPVPGAEGMGARTRARLAEVLPAALVPASFTVVDRLPVNANGKVDHALLPPPGAAGSPVDSRDGQRRARPDGPEDELLESVLDAFRRVLDQPGLGPDDDFFEAGGTRCSPLGWSTGCVRNSTHGCPSPTSTPPAPPGTSPTWSPVVDASAQPIPRSSCPRPPRPPRSRRAWPSWPTTRDRTGRRPRSTTPGSGWIRTG